MKLELPLTLEAMYATGFTTDRKNRTVKATESTISRAEAQLLMRLVAENNAAVTLETGVAFGASALAICQGKKDIPAADRMHYGVDPNQVSEYAEAAIVSLEKENLAGQFHLLEGPSHLMIPDLIRKGVRLDLAFVDGWHTFDYTLVDFFLIDKMLKPGGIIAFHDMYSLAKQKVLRFILTHRKYTILYDARISGNESRWTTLKFFLWRLRNRPRLLFSSYHWTHQLFNSSGLIVLRKEADFEPDFTYYKPF